MYEFHCFSFLYVKYFMCVCSLHSFILLFLFSSPFLLCVSVPIPLIDHQTWKLPGEYTKSRYGCQNKTRYSRAHLKLLLDKYLYKRNKRIEWHVWQVAGVRRDVVCQRMKMFVHMNIVTSWLVGWGRILWVILLVWVVFLGVFPWVGLNLGAYFLWWGLIFGRIC